MADGSVVFNISADDKEAQKKLNQLQRDIEKTAQALDKSQGKRNAIAEQLQTAREEAEKAQQAIQDLQAQYQENAGVLSGRTGNIDMAEFEARKQAQAEITYELKQQEATRAKQAALVEKLEGQEQTVTREIEQQTAKMNALRGEAGEMTRALSAPSSNALPQLKAQIEGVTKQIRKSAKSILKWGFGIRSAFILVRRLRSALKEGIQAYAEQDETLKANLSGLKNSLTALKASWGAAFAPIINAVTPMLQKLISLLATAAEYVQMFFAALSGASSYKKVIANNEDLAKSYGGAGGAAEDAKKQLMGFDEINKLNGDKGGGGGGGALPGYDTEDQEIPDKLADFVERVKKNLVALEFAASFASLAIGCILAFSGANVPLGLALIALGAAGLAHTAAVSWDGVPEQVKEVLFEVMAVLSVALFAIGAILAFSGNVGLGLGLMAAGAIGMGTIAVNWDILPEQVRHTIQDILVAIGAGMLALGVIMMFAGPATFKTGLALALSGGLALGAGIALDPEYLKKRIHDMCEKIKEVWNAFIESVKQKWEELKEKLGETVDRIKTNLVTKFTLMKADISTAVTRIKAAVVNKFNEIKDGIVEKFQAAKDKVKEIVNSIKEFFTNLRIEPPHLAVPHIGVQWQDVSQSAIAKLLGITALPHFNISWYAKGGIVDGATLFGAGEAGKEAIVPLERNTEWIDMVVNGLLDRLSRSPVVNGSLIPPRAVNGSMFSDADIDRLARGIANAFTEGEAGDQSIKLYLDGRQIAETVTKHQRRIERGYA